MVTSTTSSSVSLSWTETGTNTTTTLYRQSYALSGNAVGDPAVIATYQSLSAGAVSYTDAGTVTRFRYAGSELQPDHQYDYQIVEQWGTSGCFYTQGGNTCASSPSRFGYTRSAFEYPAGRVQLRVKVSSVATAAAPSDHIDVSLADGNSTWLDSTQSNFTAARTSPTIFSPIGSTTAPISTTSPSPRPTATAFASTSWSSMSTARARSSNRSEATDRLAVWGAIRS